MFVKEVFIGWLPPALLHGGACCFYWLYCHVGWCDALNHRVLSLHKDNILICTSAFTLLAIRTAIMTVMDGVYFQCWGRSHSDSATSLRNSLVDRCPRPAKTASVQQNTCLCWSERPAISSGLFVFLNSHCPNIVQNTFQSSKQFCDLNSHDSQV